MAKTNCKNGCNLPVDCLDICRRCYRKVYYHNNIDKERKVRKSYNKDNLATIRNRKREREKIDINYKLTNRLRHRLYNSIKNKCGSSVDNLGCSVEELKQHLESKFQPGMTWDNYGKWHIDHIKPLSKFNLIELEELKKACNYTNLQPLWAEDNLRKGGKHG